MATAPDFDPALGDLQDHLPDWWRTRDPASQLYLVLTAIGGLFDEINVLWEQPYLDQAIDTASQAGLTRNFAFAWGLQNEQLPPTTGQLVAYIKARASEDGSLASFVNTLTSLVDSAANTTGGDVLVFPSNGAGLSFPDPSGSNLVFPMSGGLTFPADGTGLVFGAQPAGITMYEFAPGNGPSASVGLVFPPDGSGLTFPIDPLAIASDNTIVADGTVPLGAGPGLIFASNQFVQIVPNFAAYTLTVKVQNWMSFDRAAFARAVHRFQPADWLPTLIVEISDY